MKKRFKVAIIMLVVVLMAFSSINVLAIDYHTPESGMPFEDVHSYDWFYNPVVWVFQNGIMNGISDTNFAPNGEMTRAMLVTVLWRYADMPGANAVAFADVAGDTWYSEAIAWAATNGIVMGYDENTFGPNDFVNREQMYTILYRYMNFAGLTIILEDEMRLQQFADADNVSDWAKEAMYFMYDAGVMFRYSTLDVYARPQQNTSRGEIAGAMYFFDRFAVLSENNQVSNGELDFEIGNVRLIANGVEHEPYIHFVHATTSIEGYLVSVSGLRFSLWLEEVLDTIPEIQYVENLQVVIEGQDGKIASSWDAPEYYEEIRLVNIFAGSFVDGKADVSLPDVPGTYLLLVNVQWSGGGEELVSYQYVFKIVK